LANYAFFPHAGAGIHYNQAMIDILHREASSLDKQGLYGALDRSLRDSSFDGSAAQAHGIACGLVCRAVNSEELPAAIEHLNFSDSVSTGALQSLLEMSTRDLNQAEFSFDLWLPDIDELSIQLEALAEWSQGYIIGLMFDGSEVRTQLSAELNDSVQDMIDIAGLESTTSSTADDEIAFVELREYLRMVTQLIYEELNPNRPLESSSE
jgi:uncharacterized protein YgfB (UPF0149 family)